MLSTQVELEESVPASDEGTYIINFLSKVHTMKSKPSPFITIARIFHVFIQDVTVVGFDIFFPVTRKYSVDLVVFM